MNSLVIVALTVLTGISCEKHRVQVERSGNVTFICSKTKTVTCGFYKYIHSKSFILNRTANNDLGFKIRDEEFCIIEGNFLRVFDSGEYHCITDNDYEVFYLRVNGKSSKLYYNNKLWKNNSENLISSDEQLNVSFKCHSFLQKRVGLKTIFKWMVDGKLIKTQAACGRQNDDLYESESTIQVSFSSGEKPKEIKCNIRWKSDNEVLIGTFGMPYPTNEVLLQDNSVLKGRTVLESNPKKITCLVNGFPYPKDIVVKKATEGGDWTVVSLGAMANVSESGTFLCEARNDDGNGNKMETFVTSNQLTFRNYDKELAVMTKMLSELNATVIELERK